MSVWLVLEAKLHFNPNLRPIFPRDYRADATTENDEMYYGVHFVSAPHKVNPGDQVTVKMVLRAFPKDPCASFQVGKKIFLKEGPLTRAEGTITRREELTSPSNTILEVQRELYTEEPQ
jgi:hypothetical protein